MVTIDSFAAVLNAVPKFRKFADERPWCVFDNGHLDVPWRG
jgi:hypothetical protein